MHWSNNCSNPFSYGYNSSLESNCFDCPNYNPSFSKHYFCQQGYNINNNNSKLSPVVSPVNSSLITSKYNENINNRFSNFQTLTPSLLPTNQIKMRTDIDSQGKDAAEVSWGIMLPMQVSSNNNNLNKKLQWSYDLTNINNNKWDWNPCLDREKCVSSDTFKSLYSPNEFMLMSTQSSLKSDMSENNRYTTSASKGILRNNIKSNSQIKLINNNGINNSGESLLPYSNLNTGKGMNNNFNIETLQQTLSSVSFSDDNNPPSFTTSNNSAPSPSKKTWALIVGKHEKPSNLTYSNFSLRTNNVKRELNGPISNIKAKTIMNTDVTVSNDINNKINMNDFDCNLKNAKFFVIKSYSEDDVYRSIKYQIWCSTETGNRRLDNAYSNCCVGNAGNGLGAEVPIYLFFSVNGSGHFCGVAKMVSSVDYKTRASVWAQGKWKGQFRVKWIFVKDVPNTQLRHIRIETNENKPVTNSRDVTEIPFEKGRQVLKIIANFKASSSIYDDFDHYEQRELLELNQ